MATFTRSVGLPVLLMVLALGACGEDTRAEPEVTVDGTTCDAVGGILLTDGGTIRMCLAAAMRTPEPSVLGAGDGDTSGDYAVVTVALTSVDDDPIAVSVTSDLATVDNVFKTTSSAIVWSPVRCTERAPESTDAGALVRAEATGGSARCTFEQKVAPGQRPRFTVTVEHDGNGLSGTLGATELPA